MIHRTAPEANPETPALSEMLTGLSQALDITEGHPTGHTVRSCLIGMRLAHIVGVRASDRTHLFYALLLKDAGCSSNAARVHQLFGGNDQEAKRAVWLRDWRSTLQRVAYRLEYAGRGGSVWDRISHLARLAMAGPRGRRELFAIRSDRGASLALGLGLSDRTAAAIRTMDEHWDGGGEPRGLRRHDIPFFGRIIGLAQVVEIFSHERGPAAGLDVAEQRNGRWFDPDLVRALRVLVKNGDFWCALKTEHAQHLVSAAEPTPLAIVADENRMDHIADAFAAVIDAKSPYTSAHSRRVADVAVAIASRLGFSKGDVARARRAALLHDIGKLGVPNSILDKPSKLTNAEWHIVRQHPGSATLRSTRRVITKNWMGPAITADTPQTASAQPRGRSRLRTSPMRCWRIGPIARASIRPKRFASCARMADGGRSALPVSLPRRISSPAAMPTNGSVFPPPSPSDPRHPAHPLQSKRPHSAALCPWTGTFLPSEERGHFYFALTGRSTTLDTRVRLP